MTQYWEPGTDYNLGDVVEYEGHKYKIIQAHRSQSDWTPPATPALWGKLHDDDHGQHQHQQHQQEHQQQQPLQQPTHHQQPPSYQDHSQNQDQLQQGLQPSDQKIEPTKEEQKTHWYDLDDKRKKQLEIGGGLAAGAALLTGGYLLFKEHEKSEEQKKAQAWAATNWINEAQARTDQFNRNGPTGPATWVLTQGKNFPKDAIEVGQENSSSLYICRAYFEGGKQIGKASDALQKGAVIGYKHEEINLDTYEILLGDMNGLRWEPAHGKLNVSSLRYRPVEGGHEDDGSPLYIAQALYKSVVYPGKASEKLDGAYIPYGGTEKNVKEYRILCYNN